MDAILSLVSSYGGYISSLSIWEDRAVLAVKVPQGSMSDVADSNKTVIIRFDKPSEPPAIDLEALPGLASTLASYLVTGLMILAIIIMPLTILMLAVITVAKRMYHRLAPARRQGERKQ